MKVNLSNSPVNNRLVISTNKNNKNNNQATNSINQNKISNLIINFVVRRLFYARNSRGRNS